MMDARIVSISLVTWVVLPRYSDAIDDDLLFVPARAPRRAALIAPALGVPPRFYRAFAQFLQGEGLAVRIAALRGDTLAAWAARDLPDALADLATPFPDAPRVWIGHSMGGQLFGM